MGSFARYQYQKYRRNVRPMILSTCRAERTDKFGTAQAITAHVLSSSFFQKSQTISCYLSMPAGEVDTWPMVDAILKAGRLYVINWQQGGRINLGLLGKKLFVPKIDVTLEDGKMDLLRLHDSEDLRSLPSGVWGIKEPHNDWNGTKRESGLSSLLLLAFDNFTVVDFQPSIGFVQSCARYDPLTRQVLSYLMVDVPTL